MSRGKRALYRFLSIEHLRCHHPTYRKCPEIRGDATPRGRRSNNLTPSLSSTAASVRVSAGCVEPSTDAAAAHCA